MSPPPRPPYRDRNLQIIFSITLMAVLGVSVISPALPTMVRVFDITPQQVGWLITVFTLPGVALTPVLGILADRVGRKTIVVPSLLLFGLAGGGCALAPDFAWLVGLRLLQGVGAASLGSLNMTLIGDLFPPPQRSAAMGYNGSVLSVGTATYPALGGALTMLGWSYPFLLALVAVPVGLVALVWLDEPRAGRRPTLREYLRDVGRGVARREVLGVFLVSVCAFILLYGSYLTYLPFLLEQRFASPPWMIGIVFSSASVVTAFCSWNLGRLTRWVPERTLIAAAFVLYSLALLAVPFGSSVVTVTLPVLAYGAANGICMPAASTLLAGLAPLENRAAFMSLNGTVLRLGQTLGPLAMGAVCTRWGVDATFHAGAGLAVVSLVVIAALLRPARAVTSGGGSGPSRHAR